MLNESEKKNYKEQLERIRGAYVEILLAFHNVKHYTAEKNLHAALFPLNRAIVDLEEAIK